MVILRAVAWRSWLVGTLVVIACGSGPTTGSQPSDGYTLAAHTLVVSRRQADEATVSDDKIVFPRASNDDLLARVSGDVLVGDRHSNAASTNRYGFARKVASVQVVADTIVVLTAGDASLEDIFAHASFSPKVKLDTFRKLSSSTIGTKTLRPADFEGVLSDSFGGDYAPIDILKVKGNLPKFQIKGKEVELAIEASAKLSEAKFIFTPTVDIGVEVADAHLNHFHLALDGDVDVAIVGEVDVSAGITVGGIGETDLATEDKDGLFGKIAEQVAKSSDLNPSITTPDLVRVEGAGPMLGPVPTTVEFTAKVACSVAAKGGLNGRLGIRARSGLTAGVAYDRDSGWKNLSSARLDVEQVGPEWTKVYGGVELKCGIQPRIAWKLAAAFGPYLQLEAGDKLSFEYSETCPSPPKASLKPDVQGTLKNELYLEGAAGGVVKVLGVEVADVGRPIFQGASYPLTTGTIAFGDDVAWSRCTAGDAGVPQEGGTGGAIAIDLQNSWTTASKPPISSRNTLVDTFASSSTSVTLVAKSDGVPGGGCACVGAGKVEIPLGQVVNCSTARLRFNYTSSAPPGDAENNTSLWFEFRNLPNSGGGYLGGSTTFASNGCNGVYKGGYPTGFGAPPRLVEGLNTIDLSTLTSGDNGLAVCTGQFSTLTVYVESRVCGAAGSTNTQTLSNLELLP